MNSKKSILNMGKIVILVVAAIMITAISTKAATAGWSLRYTKGAPSSDVITSKTVSDKMSSTKVVSAVVSPDKVEKGTRVSGSATITNPSILNSLYSSGYFIF